MTSLEEELKNEELKAYNEFIETHTEEERALLTNEVRIRKLAWIAFMKREGFLNYE